MRRIVCVFALCLGLCAPCPTAMGATAAGQPVGTPAAQAATQSGDKAQWFARPPRKPDRMWTHGTSLENVARPQAHTGLARRKTAQTPATTPPPANSDKAGTRRPAHAAGKQTAGKQAGMNTTGGIERSLQTVSNYRLTPESTRAPSKKSPFSAGMRTEEHTWHEHHGEPVRVDQKMTMGERKIVGAYADVLDENDMHLTFGPEVTLSKPGVVDSVMDPNAYNPNAVGMGMKFEWGF